MALIYKCDYCDSEYEATISNGDLVYNYGNRLIHIKTEKKECEECKKESDKARSQALENIKRGRNGSASINP